MQLLANENFPRYAVDALPPLGLSRDHSIIFGKTMNQRKIVGWFCCLMIFGSLLWNRGNWAQPSPSSNQWVGIAPGVLRSSSQPAGYALLDGEVALLIDAPTDGAGLVEAKVKEIDGVLLTHYHRDSVAFAGKFLKDNVAVRAPHGAAEWLTRAGVKKYWRESLPLRGSRTAYLVHATGFDGIDGSLKDGQVINWRGWKLTIVDTPGHALAHAAIVAQKGNGPKFVFCGGAFTSVGKMWAPFTTDWDHWTDAGLVPTRKSLQRLADLRPEFLCPAHGPVLARGVDEALATTMANVEEVGFLRSFERYTKKRLGQEPRYQFLAKEQAESNGSKPWTRVSTNLWITGNTYVLTSKEGACLMFDPWGKRLADQFVKLQTDQKLGPLEVVLFSHAHYDHYDGIYDLPNRDQIAVWALDKVADPIAEPFRLRAPFLDARPVKFDRRPKDGESLTWREYKFRFHHLPGQSEFTMGVEATIDGKRCFFTADNFFHQDMFSGSGGWMGLNRSFPPLYAASAQKVLDAGPDWVLAEHGGPFEFSAEDFRRRVQWGEAGAKAADALSPSGQHLHDWNPHRVRIEPLVHQARPGAKLKATLAANNVLPRKEKIKVVLEGRGVFPDQTFELEVPAQGARRVDFTMPLPNNLTPGRHVFTLRSVEGILADGVDAFVAVDIVGSAKKD